MAQSKNKRRNGKVVKSNRAKRMRTMAGYDLKHLMICNVVDLPEIDGETRMTPRSLVFDTKQKQPVTVTSLQEVAIKKERWRWEVHYGVICRNPDGTVYLDKDVNFLCKEEYRLTELNEFICDSLIDAFERANPLHRLTMFWVASPIEQEKIPLEAVLSPVWHFNVLGNMLTQWEQENEGHLVVHYRTDKLMEFCSWFLNQGKHKKDLSVIRDITFSFEPSDIKMQKGELVAYRDTIKTALNKFSSLDFKPLATVKGFCEFKHWTLTCDGVGMLLLMEALEKCPPSICCLVSVKYLDGSENLIKFEHNKLLHLGAGNE